MLLIAGITMSLRLVGPTLGFLFAGVCLKMYIAPSLTPLIGVKDPRWLGAWWLGWVVLGCLMGVTSFTIAMFPRELPRAARKRRDKEMVAVPKSREDLSAIGSKIFSELDGNTTDPPKLSKLPKAVMVLLKNKINLYNTLAGVFYLFSAIGYWTYMPKYLETIFMQTAVNASIISGVISILFQAIGLLFSGWLISKYQPSARMLAAWNVFLNLLYVFVKISFTQMGCNPGEFAFGTHDNETGTWNLNARCNEHCNCRVNKIQPICHMERNEIYYSACHAGCTTFENGLISNCSCISDPDATIMSGTCNDGCLSIFLLFLGVNAAIKLIDSSGRIGNMLVSYRCVDPKDKSLAIGVSIFLISVLAMLPSPILFGKIFDSVCVVWGTKCGGRGNCWLYDGERLRYLFNLTAAGFTSIGVFFDVLVFCHVKNLDLYDEEKNVESRKLNRL